MPSKSRSPRKSRLTAADHRRLESGFANAGLQRRWWKEWALEWRRCPRCGGALVWRRVPAEERHRFVCRACARIAYQNPKIVAATLPVRKGKIVLLRRAIEPARGRWSHPAGFMELGETVTDAARRETREEIRARVRLTRGPFIYSYGDAAVVTVVYEGTVVGRAPSAGVESLEVRSFRPEEIPWDELAFRSTYHALRDWVERRSGAKFNGGEKALRQFPHRPEPVDAVEPGATRGLQV